MTVPMTLRGCCKNLSSGLTRSRCSSTASDSTRNCAAIAPLRRPCSWAQIYGQPPRWVLQRPACSSVLRGNRDSTTARGMLDRYQMVDHAPLQAAVERECTDELIAVVPWPTSGTPIFFMVTAQKLGLHVNLTATMVARGREFMRIWRINVGIHFGTRATCRGHHSNPYSSETCMHPSTHPAGSRLSWLISA